MDVFCEICEKQWDMADPGVRPAAVAAIEGSLWICDDESACLQRAAELPERPQGGACQQPRTTSRKSPRPAPAPGNTTGSTGSGPSRNLTARGTHGSTRNREGE